jgi:cytochrome c oxidase subunit 1
MFGRLMNETVNKIHWLLTFVLFNIVFFPMHMLGSGGMIRRLYDPTQYPHLQPMQDTNIMITVAALALFVVQILYAGNFFWSLFRGKKVGANPWEANSLEWSAPSPPPHGNWGGTTPVVHRGPYEYSAPGVSDDYWMQTEPGTGPPAHAAH